MFATSSDYLLRSVLLGLVLEAALATLAMLAARTFATIEGWTDIGICLVVAVAGGLVTLLWRPAALLTVWKARRSPFLLEDDVRAMILGRIVGVVLGLGFGITIATTLF